MQYHRDMVPPREPFSTGWRALLPCFVAGVASFALSIGGMVLALVQGYYVVGNGFDSLVGLVLAALIASGHMYFVLGFVPPEFRSFVKALVVGAISSASVWLPMVVVSGIGSRYWRHDFDDGYDIFSDVLFSIPLFAISVAVTAVLAALASYLVYALVPPRDRDGDEGSS